MPRGSPHQIVRPELRNRADAEKSHDAVDLAAQDVENARHARLPGHGETEKMRARNQAREAPTYKGSIAVPRR